MHTPKVVFASAVPTTGHWFAGDRVVNNDWASGEALEWVCTVSGEPGTWKGVFVTEPLTYGAVAGANVTATEVAGVALHRTQLTLAATPVTVTDASAYANTKVYDFPEGRVLVLGATGSLQYAVTSDRTATINGNAGLNWAVGTAAATNVALTGTMADLLPQTAMTLSAANASLNTASSAALAASAQFDGTSTAKDAYLNISIPTGTDIDADGTLGVTGTITLTWVDLGDY